MVDEQRILLDLNALHAGYGSAMVLHGIDMTVRSHEFVGLLGANGAGKSTLLRAISGIVQPRSGEILLDGQDIARAKPQAVVQAGIAQVAEGHRIFGKLTVEQNLRLGAYTRRLTTTELAHSVGLIWELFPQLAERPKSSAASLSGGQQQMLAIGQALMAAPKLLLLDEPSAGLAPVVIEQLAEGLRELRRGGLTILIVEQHIPLTLSLADRIYVMRNGKIVVDGIPSASCTDAMLQAAYI
jgi:branched-chain amino acid transport system ATP-binding protein